LQKNARKISPATIAAAIRTNILTTVFLVLFGNDTVVVVVAAAAAKCVNVMMLYTRKLLR